MTQAALAAGRSDNPDIVFTVLVLLPLARCKSTGMVIPGRSYPRDAWHKSLVQARSLCCFAYGGRSFER